MGSSAIYIGKLTGEFVILGSRNSHLTDTETEQIERKQKPVDRPKNQEHKPEQYGVKIKVENQQERTAAEVTVTISHTFLFLS